LEKQIEKTVFLIYDFRNILIRKSPDDHKKKTKPAILILISI